MHDKVSPMKKLKILEVDPWLGDYRKDLELRMKHYLEMKQSLLGNDHQFKAFANGHHYFGFHPTDGGWVYREWAPAADALYLMGDFNGWHRSSHPLTAREAGVWEIFLEGSDALCHGSRVKVHVVSRGAARDRIPLYIRRVVQDAETHDFTGQIWHPQVPFHWTDADFQLDPHRPPLIYECHIGMAQEDGKIGSYREFEEKILPRVKAMGYNTIQLMAVMQHPYYASFGYHVSSYFAASSWFGTPEDLKSLVNTAHQMGIAVLLDIVHSHAVKNIAEGINQFDGTVHQFFHEGERGNHSAWDSKLFNYGKHEVIHFLLSGIKFWLEEYHFDGFRFDGVTSMIYHDHGLGTAFDSYEKYFSPNTDLEALTYLQFANELTKELRPDALCVAEDMSGMPGMCLPIEMGGIGFDYRLSMGMPDFWVKTLEKPDDAWQMGHMVHELSTRRPGEKRIAYVESHDQALVGDKTMIFRMADKEMYTHMHRDSQNLEVERAVALHKMARLITISLGSEGYLTFMGNEFGHPEWIDFPREGNGWSFQHCRRLWSLADHPDLRYRNLKDFDQAMLQLMKAAGLMGGCPLVLMVDEERKVIAYGNREHVFLFNFHPTISWEHLEIPTHDTGDYQVILDTDETRFGGYGRVSHEVVHSTYSLRLNPEFTGFAIYLPCRTGLVLKKSERVLD